MNSLLQRWYVHREGVEAGEPDPKDGRVFALTEYLFNGGQIILVPVADTTNAHFLAVKFINPEGGQTHLVLTIEAAETFARMILDRTSNNMTWADIEEWTGGLDL